MTNQIAIVDPFVKSPAIHCFNRLVNLLGVRATYFHPGQFGMEDLIKNAPHNKAYNVFSSTFSIFNWCHFGVCKTSWLVDKQEERSPILWEISGTFKEFDYMKKLIISSMLISTSAFAQTMDINALKGLMTSRKATLEKFYVGMSKKITDLNVVAYDDVPGCKFKQVSTQSVLKIEAQRALVLAKNKNFPANTAACRDAGFSRPEDETGSIFFISRPSLEEDLRDLDAMAASIRTIYRAGEIVTMEVFTEGRNVTIKYDLTKPSFKNMILGQDAESRTTTEDVADIDITKVDLTKVFFCGVDEEGNHECTAEGDYSDILFN